MTSAEVAARSYSGLCLRGSPACGPFRALAFLDAGNVYGAGQTPDFGTLRHTIGIELRVMVPVFGAPLRFIYSLNPDERLGDRYEAFQFSVGTTF